MQRLQKILEKPSRLVAGAMSGTSADAVDVALVRISGHGVASQFEQVGFGSYPHSRSLREKILSAIDSAGVQDIAELHRDIAESFAEAILKTLKASKIPIANLDLVGSHGQTVFHHSSRGKKVSLQIGDGDWIAEITGAVVVSDFRQRDLAAGGEGAPISAYPDFLLFGQKKKNVAVLNLGGIANITFLSDSIDSLLAFDTGPANMLIDGLVRHFCDGKQTYDCDGKVASQGKVDKLLLSWLMEHPFIQQPTPKSTGRESFGDEFLDQMIQRRRKTKFEDLVATATEFTVKSISLAIRDSGREIEELIVGGGGVRNLFLMERLRRELRSIPVVETKAYGIDAQAREAIAMAILANETLHGSPGNHVAATGAKRQVPLGKISL